MVSIGLCILLVLLGIYTWNLEGKYTQLKADYDTANERIETISETLNENIDSLNAQVTQLKEDYNTLNDKEAELEASVSELSGTTI